MRLYALPRSKLGQVKETQQCVSTRSLIIHLAPGRKAQSLLPQLA